MTLDLKVQNMPIGTGYVQNVALSPGNNSLDFTGAIDYQKILDNLPYILGAESEALSEGNLELFATGQTVVYDGVHITFYEEVLRTLTLSTQIGIGEVLSESVQNVFSLPLIIGDIQSLLGLFNITMPVGI